MKQCIVSGMRVFLSMCLFIGFTSSASFALDPPTGVSASDGTYTSEVRVTWNSVPGASHYLVYCDGRPTSRLWQTSTTYHDTSATPGQTFHYQVRAATSENGENPSGYSISNPGWRKLSPPTGVRVSTAFTDKIMIVWDSVPGATHYLVYRDNAPISSTWQSSTIFHDTGTTPGQVHNYTVRAAVSASGSRPSDLSAPVSGWRKLSPPTGVSASDGTYTDKVLVTWNPVPGATHYLVYKGDTPGVMPPTDRVWQTSTTYADIYATPGQTYYYKIRAAMSEYGDRPSNFSTIDSGWRKLSRPTGVSASDGTYPDKVRITWNSVPGATHYRVYRNTSNNSAGAIALGNWQTETAYDDLSVSVGQTYWYWVKAATSSSGARASALSNYNTGYADNSVPVDPCYCPPGQICPTVECDEILLSPTSSGLLDEYILSDNHLIFPAELPDQATLSEVYDSNVSAVPEPTTVVLFILGLLGLTGFLRHSRKKS